MAYTSVIPVHRLERTVDYVQDKSKTSREKDADSAASLEEAVDYALNRDKTERDVFESAIGCTCRTAYEDMLAVKKRWHKLGGVQGYHMVQSFRVGEVTPELAHKIGLEFARQHLGGKYQVLVTTHLNTEHIHNHLVWNSVSMVHGKKYRSNAKSYFTEVRAQSDALCRQYGLSVIDTERAASVAMPYVQWQAEQNDQPTWRSAIRQDVDEAVSVSLTWRQFLRALEQKGYELQLDRKYPTLKPPGKERPVRFKTLGANYTPETIQRRILYPRRHSPTEENRGSPLRVLRARLRTRGKPMRKLTGLRALYYRYLYELGALPRKPRHPSYAARQDIRKLDTYIAQMHFLDVHGIDTRQQLTAYRQPLQAQIAELTRERCGLYRTQQESPRIRELTQQLKSLRQEDKMCRDIERHSQEVQCRLAQAKAERLERQKAMDEKQKSKEKTIWEMI